MCMCSVYSATCTPVAETTTDAAYHSDGGETWIEYTQFLVFTGGAEETAVPVPGQREDAVRVHARHHVDRLGRFHVPDDTLREQKIDCGNR